MIWFAIGTALLVLVGVAVVAAGVGGTMDPDAERPATVLPGDDLAPDDLRGVRFTAAVSGYHPQEVDALLERIADQWTAAAAAAEPGSAVPHDVEPEGEAPADPEADETAAGS